MNILTRWRIFQKAAIGILIVFFGMMIFVAIVAHMRLSGSTRQDMTEAQRLRKESLFKKPETTQTAAQ